jgi:hypothetical protein
MTNIFPILILNARPAAGKSEIIDYLKRVPLEDRIARFHIGPLQILDDFPMLWTWFEEDDLLESIFHRPRLHTTPDGDFIYLDLWNLLIRRLSLEYIKQHRDQFEDQTTLIEFSRGAQHGGYQAAYQHLSDAILKQAACLYLRVSFAESLRKNRARYNPDRPDSILEHGLSDDKMERLYRDDDWDDFTTSDPEFLTVRNYRIPYAVFENEDDVTTAGGELLGMRLEKNLQSLWSCWLQNKSQK